MLQPLTRRGSAPALSEQTSFDVPPAPVERFGAFKPLDLNDGVRAIDQKLVAVADRTNLASDDTFRPAEEADHARTIGIPDPVG